MDTKVPATRRAWMRLPSGRRLDLMNPDPMGWTDEDLAVRLSRTCRWGGESCGSFPLSVAQHSLVVLGLVRLHGPLCPAHALRELLHDAEEAFLGFDCISPLKRALGEPFARVSARLTDAVAMRYGLPAWTDEAYRRHKEADSLAALCEAIHVLDMTDAEVRDVMQVEQVVIERATRMRDPIAEHHATLDWQAWRAEFAAERFLEELCRLKGLHARA